MPEQRAELWVLEGEHALHVEPIGPRGLSLGRSPGNDLVLADAAISARHAALDWDGGALVLTDLASRNGTTVGGQRVSRVALRSGDRIVLGDRVRLQVFLHGGPARASAWELELDGAVRLPVRRDRLRLGGGPDDDVQLPHAPPGAATLVWVGDEVRLLTEDDDQPLAPDLPTPVAGSVLVLRRVDGALSATVPLERVRYDYALEVSLDGPTGPRAVVSDPATGRARTIDSETRAVLLWVLGRQWLQDADRDPPDRGWCTDDELLLALWGRAGAVADPTRLRVLLSRVRKELAAAGLDGACLEKRQGHLRIRLGSARLAG